MENEKDILDYFSKRMPTSNPNEVTPLDLSFMASFDKNFGFRYNLESVTAVEEKGKILQVMVSICPPGSPYLEEGKNLFAAFPFTAFDWNSTEDTIKFNEDDLVILGLQL